MAKIERFIGTWKLNWGNGFYSSISRVVIEEESSDTALAKFYRTDHSHVPPVLEVGMLLRGDLLTGRHERGGREFVFEVFPAFEKELIGASQRARPSSGELGLVRDDPDSLAGTWGAEDVGGGHGGEEVEWSEPRQARAS